MIKKIFSCMLLGSFVLCSVLLAQTNSNGLKVDKRKALFSLTGNEQPGEVALAVKPHSGNDTGQRGPGTLLMKSWYDLGSNGESLANLVDYGDGTLAFARMGAKLQDKSDRGSFYSYFNGASFGPVNKVEAQMRGWTNLAAFSDGREVVVSHGAGSGLEVNIDALKGFGLWTSTTTGSFPGTQISWPRLTINSSNHIIICSTTNGTLSGITNIKQVARSLDDGATWTHQLLRPDTTVRKPSFTVDDQAIDSFGNKVAIAVAELGGDIHLWESNNNGASFTYRNVTNYSTTIPKGAQQIRPWRTCDVIYDHNGNIHIFWEAVLAVSDSAGTGIDLFYNRSVGIQHWSMAAGIRQAVSWSRISIASLESDEDLFRAGAPFNQINANSTLTTQPQARIDVAGNLYLMFSAYRPLDFDIDFTHFTDIYVTGSKDGGLNWGQVANVTNSINSEDLWPSLAKKVTNRLRFVYQSDGTTGNSIFGGGLPPTEYYFYSGSYGFTSPDSAQSPSLSNPAQVLCSGQIQVFWSSPDVVDGYNIYHRTGPSGSYSLVGSVGIATTYIHTPSDICAANYYKVTAYVDIDGIRHESAPLFIGSVQAECVEHFAGWNLVSVPLLAPDMRKIILFPTARSDALWYSPGVGYVSEATLANGKGYWISFPSAIKVFFCGTLVSPRYIPVSTGWNLVGPFESDVAITAITSSPTGIVDPSTWLEFTPTGYHSVVTLKKGLGYWVKVGATGLLMLP